MKEKKVVYYREETDILYESHVRTKTVDKDFDYERRGIADVLLRQVFVRLLVIPFARLWVRLVFRSAFVGRRKLRKHKGGCFVYGNHTQDVPDAFRAAACASPRMSYIITHADNVSFPGIQKLMMALGTLPIPTKLDGMRNFMAAVEKRCEKHPVVIFPEKTIWEYYTGIRPFTDASFHYPVKCNKPCFTMTVTYHKRKFSDKPREVVYIDGPFYPDESLPVRERTEKLRDEVRGAMLRRAAESDYEYVRYVRLEKE